MSAPYKDIDLSVVVVTYNEEDNIDDCLDSIFRHTEPYLSEVIVVDSNSTDDTVDIAAEYPVTILQITDERYCSPSAGRFVGTRRSCGEFILFVDGDLTLEDGWLTSAFEEFEKRDNLGGVSGQLNSSKSDASISEVDAIKAVMLFRRDVLDDVGTFHPFVTGSEDYELSFRIREGGYTLLQLPEIVARHPRHNHVEEPFRRLVNGYAYGFGQTIRLHYNCKEFVKERLWKIRKEIGLIAWLGVGIVSLIAPTIFYMWSIITATMFIILGTKFGFIKTGMYPVRAITHVSASIISFVNGVQHPDNFPSSAVTIVKE